MSSHFPPIPLYCSFFHPNKEETGLISVVAGLVASSTSLG